MFYLIIGKGDLLRNLAKVSNTFISCSLTRHKTFDELTVKLVLVLKQATFL